ncbi:MAG: glycosyltransferase family 4 protein [Xanthomonadaceae bacterium]|jgi:glycosyltransferase involved in cell wall biosynthesis|nr:glycosyltransferase family 4 protein [Xanthomonadaceae bacterium]
MKFFFVGSSSGQGGAETHFVALAQALIGADHSVSAAVRPDTYLSEQLDAVGVRTYSLRLRNSLDVSSYRMLAGIFRRENPDLLLSNFGRDYWPLIALGKCLRIPVSIFRHRVGRLKSFSNFALPRLAQHFFAVSEYARKIYLGYGMPADCVRVMYNPVDTRRYRPDAERGRRIRRSLNISKDALVVGYCGRLIENKGIFVLKQALDLAMAVEPRLHCIWVGGGVEERRLREETSVTAYARQHHFTGLVDDVYDYYNAFSMLAFPSLAPEAFGRVSIEAQACGVPVIGSDIGGIPETMHTSVSGMLVAPGDAQAWCDAILKMCNADIREPMSDAGRSFVDCNFSTGVIAHEMVSLLETDLSGMARAMR